jgi:hypothetical protein
MGNSLTNMEVVTELQVIYTNEYVSFCSGIYDSFCVIKDILHYNMQWIVCLYETPMIPDKGNYQLSALGAFNFLT